MTLSRASSWWSMGDDGTFGLPGPEDIHRVELPNGIVVLCRHHPHTASVVLRGALFAGAYWDPLPKMGLAAFVASMLKRGTAKYTHGEIYDLLESRGASLNFAAHFHTVGFGGQALAEDLPLLLELLAQALRAPTFPEEEVEKRRDQILTSLDLQAQDPEAMAEKTFDAILYRDHPYARPEEGFRETVQAITREDLIAFHARQYGPRNMILVVVGAVPPKQVEDLVRQHLEDWQVPDQPGPPTLPPVSPLPATIRRFVPIPDKSQADIVLGVVGPARKDPDYFPAMLGNSILGRFGLMGRLGDVVREQAGLAYYVYSNLGAGLGPGPWEIHAGVAPENVPQAIELIVQEIRRFVQEPVTEEELNDVKSGALGRLPLSLETNAGVAAALLNMELYDLGLDYLQRYPDLVRGVTREAILETARRYWDPERLAIAVAGPTFPGGESWPQGAPTPEWFSKKAV